MICMLYIDIFVRKNCFCFWDSIACVFLSYVEMIPFQQKTFKIEKDSKLSQNIYFDKMKFFWKLMMICFSYFCKKNCFSFCVWPMQTPFWSKLGPIAVFRDFIIFFTTTGLLKLLILIVSPKHISFARV